MDRSARIRVLLVDDHTAVRAGLRALIDAQDDMTVVAEAADGPTALQLAASVQPRVALMDLSMHGSDGVSTTRTMTDRCPDVRIIAVTRHTDESVLTQILEAGAAGYVLKQSPSAELTRAVRAVANGEQYVDPAMKSAPMPAPPPPLRSDHGNDAPLTAAEEQVLRGVGACCSNQEIAERLRMDVTEVGAHKVSAMGKLNLSSRVEVMRYLEQRDRKPGV